MGMLNQHYIPQFYLKGFTDKSKILWVYERHKALRQSKPKYEAHRPDYYTLQEEGLRNDAVEKELAQVESLAAPVIRKLITPQFVPGPRDIIDLLMFVGFMFARVPAWRENLNKVAVQVAKKIHGDFARDKEAFHKICTNIAGEKGVMNFDQESFRREILSEKYELTQTSASFNLHAMFRSALSIARTLREFGYQVFFAPPGKTFLTSDAPVFTLGPDENGVESLGMGFGWPGTAVIFPLNKRACLYLKRGIQCRAVRSTAERVDEINRLVMMTAATYLYSSESLRRTSRLFNHHGCVMRAGENAFMTTPPPKGWQQRRGNSY